MGQAEQNMPELPEVETLRMGLEKYLVGHKIENIDVKVASIFHGDPKSVIGAKIEGVRRFGKGLVVDLSNGHSLAVHVKLTGQLVFRNFSTKNEPLSKKVGASLPGKFTHIIFTLDRGATLYYNDIRRIGWIKVVATDDLNSIPFFKEMGPEPPVAKALEDESAASKPPHLMRIAGYYRFRTIVKLRC